MFRSTKRWLWLILCWFMLAGHVWAMPCDVDDDGDIDRDDLTLIQQAILARAPVSGPNDPRDPDSNGRIDSIDGRLCALRCTRARCSTTNQPPFANAGPDQSVRVGDLVSLSGSASSDPDGDPLRYLWTFSNRPLGSLASLIDAATVAPHFIADKPGQYLIQLIVNDGHADSAPDTVTVSTENSRPIANAGPDQSVRVGTLVSLNGGGSTDVDGDPLRYTWQLSNVPPGSSATLRNPDSVNPTLLIDQPGNYRIALTVSDETLSSLPDTVLVSTENSPPVANAGANQAIPLGGSIILDGSRSSDVDGDPLTFRWSLLARPAGSQAVLSDATAVSPRFLADYPGTYVAQLIVNDGSVDSAPASVSLSTANAAPVANAGPDQTVPLGSLVSLDGSASRDPEGALVSYSWSLTGKPVGSNAALDASNSVNPGFTADLPGDYVVQLIVNDGTLASATDTVTISTANSRPVADAGPPQTVAAGTRVRLDGSASHDADGDQLSFAWSLTAVPVGSRTTLSAATTIDPSFTPDIAGTYVAQLIVSDGRFDSLPVTVVITVSAANRKPLAVAQAIPTSAPVGSTVLLKGTDSSDPDNDPLTWAWSIVFRPGGSLASIVSPSAAQTSFVPDVAGSYTIQLLVNDGKVDSAPALLVVQALPGNHPPVITSTAVTSATAGMAYGYDVEATDPDAGDVLSYSLQSAPTGMSIDPVSGLIEWRASEAQVGSHPISVRVIDQGGLSAIQDFTIIVGPPNHPPIITSVGITSQWTQLAPTGENASSRHVSGTNTYDAINDRLIAFGGDQNMASPLNDTWVLIDATAVGGASSWLKLDPAGTIPAGRHSHSAVYDPTANRLIIYGGCVSHCSQLADAWVLTNANGLGGAPEWISLPSGVPSMGHAAGYDPASNRMIVFGGLPAGPGSDTNAVRMLVDANGIGSPQWITLTPDGAPPSPRGHWAEAVYDPISNRLLVYGGRTSRGVQFDDVWVLHNANGLGGTPRWEQLAPNGSGPSLRDGHSTVHDPNTNRLIVHSGVDYTPRQNVYFNETWILTNANGVGGTPEWIKQTTAGTPPAPRAHFVTGYARASNRMVLAFGRSQDASGEVTVYDDAWVLANASGLCTVGQPCTFKATASDPDAGDVLAYSFDAAPAGMAIDPASGAIVWTPVIAQIGDHAVTVRATDRGGLFATQSFTATVAPVAVPNVVGLAPEWAESFITAADLAVGAKTSQGGAITLNFDSLPSRQGWAYEASRNTVAEDRIFSVAGGLLLQDSIGIPMTGQDHNIYRMLADISPRLPFAVEMTARVLEEQATYSFGFCFDVEGKPRLFGVGIGQSGLLAQGTPASLGSTNVDEFHTYRVLGEGGSAFTFWLDGAPIASGNGSPVIPPLDVSSVLFGDCTGGNNARANIAAYSFTQPRVVGQNPPAGTLVTNQSTVDLTIVDGPATETVPNLVSLSQATAETTIVAADLTVGGITNAPHPTIPAGQVSDQSPLPNIHVPKGTPVAIVMSTGPPAPVNVAPVITSTPPLVATVGTPYTYQVTAVDPDVGDVLTYSLTTGPAGMSIDSVTGLIGWTPTAAQVPASNLVSARVVDGRGGEAEQTFSIAVLLENSRPAAISQALGILRAIPYLPPFWETSGAVTLTGNDPDGDQLSYELIDPPIHGKLTGTPPSLTYVPNACFVGADRLTFRVRDGRVDSESATVDIYVGDDCNRNGVADPLDIASGASQDCNGNSVPDECDVAVKGRGFNKLASWTAFDPGESGIGNDLDGYAGGAYDGRYVYFAPYFNGSAYSGEVLRYDTQAEFGSTAAWQAYDLPTNRVGREAWGFSGAVFDGRYVYFVPSRGQFTEVVRYDTHEEFGARSSWSVYSPLDAGVVSVPTAYFRAVFDGRYVYFVPQLVQNGRNDTPSGEVLRLDTTENFATSGAWSVFDPSSNGLGDEARGYGGAVFDGHYVYFVPLDSVGGGAGYNGKVVRYDTQSDFSLASAWSSYDSAVHGAVADRHGYIEAAYDGRYVYFGPYLRQGIIPYKQVLRYDTQLQFEESLAWSTSDAGAQVVGQNPAGYRGVVYDCRNVYFVPYLADYGTRTYHSETLSYDTKRAFESSDAWRAYNPVTAGSWNTPQGYDGAIFDGRYVYFAPSHDNVNHGTFLRYDTWIGTPDAQGNGIPDSCEGTSPVIVSTPVTTIVAGSAYAYNVDATDPDVGVGEALLYSLPTAPTGMTIDGTTGVIAWTPTLAQVGDHPVIVRVTDAGGLFAEQTFTVTVGAPSPTNQPPSITSTPVTTATADSLYSYDIEASDPDIGDVLTYSLTTAPTGMSIDPANGLIEWTPSAGQTGDQQVEVRVADGGGLAATQPFTITVSAVAVCTPPPADLISWWPGEGNALDRAAANDGVAENGPTFAPGLVGQAFRFDGVDDLIRIASSRTVGFDGPFSVDFWFNPTTTIGNSTPNQVLLAKGRYLEGGFNAPVAIQVLGGDGRLLVRMPPAPALVSVTEIWPADIWQHIALSWDGVRYRLYVNGVEEAGLDSTFSMLDSTDPITLGNADAFAAAGFAGLLDEPTLYNRALDPTEIAALHAARGLGKCTATYSRADAGPDQAVEVAATVTLDGSASRAFDGAPLSYQWTLTGRPANSTAVLTDASVVNPTFVADQAGDYSFELVVGNASRASAPDSVSITATQVNHAPTINSSPITTATIDGAYTYPVIASDPDAGDTLSYSLPVAPAGMSIDGSSGLIQWTPVVGQVGSHNVSVRVQDAGGLFAVQPFVILVAAAPVPVSVPNVVGQEQAMAQNMITTAALGVGTVAIASSDTVAAGRVISQDPAAGTMVNSGSAVNLVVSSGPVGVPVASIRVTPISPLILTGQTQPFVATGILANGSSLPLSSGLVWTSSNPTVASIDAAGVATALGEGSTTISASQGSATGSTVISVALATAGDSTLPTAAITSPADGASIATAVPIVGTASDANFLKYIVEIAPFETGTFSTLVVGTTPVTDGTLATLDPTTLVNDLYVLRLTVIDRADNRTQTEITVQLSRDKKVGNFTLAFQDLNVPMAGIPISVVRSYDSRDKTKGDFGIGWRLDVQSLRLRVVGVGGQGWEQIRSGGVLSRRYTISPTRLHKVAITLPDGKVEEFDMTVSPSSQAIAPIQVVDAAYAPRPLTRGSLRALGETRLVTLGATGAIELLTESSLQIFDPQEFEYTTAEGQVVLISRQDGVKQIRDRNGNTVSFSVAGITHSAGKSISFSRDAQNRITTVTDPNGNVQSYSYDINGDLASHTDGEGRSTGFLYNYDHGLIEIRDPRGVRPIRNEYDDAGRLIKTIDAYGKEITYTHDLGANREVITDRLGNATIHVYDDQGNVTQTADALGGVTNRSYDARGNTLSEQDPLGRSRRYTYDGQDNRLTETDPLGKTTTYTYNDSRQVLSVIDALGRTTSNTYDAAGNLTSSTDPAGNVTRYTYDSRGLQLTRTDPLGTATSYAYDASGNLTSETDALNRATTYTYDANGNRLTQSTTRSTAGGSETLLTRFSYDRDNRLTETTHPDGSVTRIAYNAIGKQSITTDQLGRETKYDHDDMGRLVKTTYPDGSSESSAYDAEGRRIGSTDRAGRTTTSTYDALGRLIATTAPDGSSTRTAYDAAGQVLSSTDARGNVTSHSYDAAGRRTQVTDALGKTTTFNYDDAGNQTQVIDANGNAVAFSYDSNSRRTRTTYADSTFDQVGYDALGRQIAKTDQAGKTTQYAYDALGRLTSVTDALGQLTRYTYDELGNQLTQTDAEGRTTSFAYDRMGRRTSRTLPLGQSERMSYDAAGNLKTKTDFNGRTTTYTYDTLNRLLRKTPDASLGEPPVIFTYTASGQRASMQDASGSTAYSYDNRDRLLAKVTPQGTLNYSYDAAGNLTKIHSNHSGGAAMDYAYDARNRLASVTDASGSTTYSYDAVGNLAGFLYPNGVQTNYTYNTLNRLTNVTGARTATLASYTYTLGPSGNRTAVTEANGRQVDYTYDDLYRLKSETISADPSGPNGAISYTYDKVGNRLTRSSTVAVIPDQSFAYDFNDRLDGEGYDDNGNTLTSGSRTFGYDFENHLVTADGGVSFVYNGDGIRVAKSAGGVTTGFLVDDRNPTGYAQVLEEIVGGSVEKSYTYGLKLVSQKQASGVSFYGFDGHGSVRYLTDASGAVTDTYSYDAFGNLVGQVGATENDYLYTGEQAVGNTGLYYLRARYLDSSSARFASLDPLRGILWTPLSLHKYLYANDDPINRIDPSGKISLAEGLAVTAIVSGLVEFQLSYHRTGDLHRSLLRGTFVAGGVYVGGLGIAFVVTAAALPTQAIFWTGGGVGGAAFQAAERFRVANPGFYTLESTALGRFLTGLPQHLPRVTNAWATASRLFASRATGEAHIFHNNPVAPNFYLNIESWALEASSVRTFVYHNVVSGEVARFTREAAASLW